MEQDRSFARRYSLNVARLKPGKHAESFEVEDDFFEHFEGSLIRKGAVQVRLQMEKWHTHLDVVFHLTGGIEVICDRCGNPYMHPIDETQRIIYAFDKSLDFEGYEVMYAESHEQELVLTQELYDFMILAIPMRKVPPADQHLCPPDVLHLLGLDEQGNPLENQEDPNDEEDPRWAALKKLRDQLD
ncbi:MAG: hypothetical protein OHK0039_46230 [Bacteroidia bacterium]